MRFGSWAKKIHWIFRRDFFIKILAFARNSYGLIMFLLQSTIADLQSLQVSDTVQVPEVVRASREVLIQERGVEF